MMMMLLALGLLSYNLSIWYDLGFVGTWYRLGYLR
jgi:hypothetical protein